MDPKKLIFVDEAGFIDEMNRLYGWAPRGEQAVISAKIRGKRLSVVGAMAMDGPRGMMTFTGSMNTGRMLEYVENHLGPNIVEGDIVVLDGMSAHKSVQVREAIEAYGGSVLILPPYSPELNPIEHLWSTLKARVRALGTSSWDELVGLVEKVWKELDIGFYKNWVRNCGYLPST